MGESPSVAIVIVVSLIVGACSSQQNVVEPALAVSTTDRFVATTTAPVSNNVSTTATITPADTPLARSITFVGTTYDQADLSALGIGSSGFWFPQFDAAEPIEGRPTDEGAVDSLPNWAGPLNHFSILIDDDGCSASALALGCRPGFAFRTFSQDGPATSAGGHSDWSTLTLPAGRTGLSGAVVDPHTDANSNNTINRIQLRVGVPETFFFHVVTDNTAGTHNPTRALRARANVGLLDLDDQVEPDLDLQPCDLSFNGVPDVYTFRFVGFVADDYIKLRLSGSAGDGGASFGGLLFDERYEPSAQPSTATGTNSEC